MVRLVGGVRIGAARPAKIQWVRRNGGKPSAPAIKPVHGRSILHAKQAYNITGRLGPMAGRQAGRQQSRLGRRQLSSTNEGF